MTEVTENKDYMLVPVGSDDNPLYHVRLLVEEFHGVLVRFNWVMPPTEDGFKFEYDILEMPEESQLSGNPKFEKLLGDILVNIILEGYNEDRKTDTKESDNE